MDRNLVALKPALVWKHFAEIVRIPRPSSHEEKIRRYILDFARAQGLESKEDAAHNVYVRKPASKGMEDRKGVILIEAEGLDEDVRARVLAAGEKLKELGATVETFSLGMVKYAVPAYYILACAEASSNLSRFDGIKYGYRADDAEDIVGLMRKSRTEGFGPEVKKRILLGTFVLSADCYDSYYKKALQARARLKAAFDAVFQRYDLLLTPVAPTTAPRLGEGLADPLSLYLSDIYTVPANLAGLPALSMPCGFDRGGLPIGAQLIGPALGDLAVLDAAHAYQQETDWHRRHPDTPAAAKGGDAL